MHFEEIGKNQFFRASVENLFSTFNNFYIFKEETL